MAKAETAKPPIPFETFVARAAAVPKSEIDALAKAESEKPRVKRGPKPGSKSPPRVR
jgi:hypothetical protein